MKYYLAIALLGFFVGNMVLASIMLVGSQIVYQKTGRILYLGYIESKFESLDETVTLPKKR